LQCQVLERADTSWKYLLLITTYLVKSRASPVKIFISWGINCPMPSDLLRNHLDASSLQSVAHHNDHDRIEEESENNIQRDEENVATADNKKSEDHSGQKVLTPLTLDPVDVEKGAITVTSNTAGSNNDNVDENETNSNKTEVRLLKLGDKNLSVANGGDSQENLLPTTTTLAAHDMEQAKPKEKDPKGSTLVKLPHDTTHTSAVGNDDVLDGEVSVVHPPLISATLVTESEPLEATALSDETPSVQKAQPIKPDPTVGHNKKWWIALGAALVVLLLVVILVPVSVVKVNKDEVASLYRFAYMATFQGTHNCLPKSAPIFHFTCLSGNTIQLLDNFPGDCAVTNQSSQVCSLGKKGPVGGPFNATNSSSFGTTNSSSDFTPNSGGGGGSFNGTSGGSSGIPPSSGGGRKGPKPGIVNGTEALLEFLFVCEGPSASESALVTGEPVGLSTCFTYEDGGNDSMFWFSVVSICHNTSSSDPHELSAVHVANTCLSGESGSVTTPTGSNDTFCYEKGVCPPVPSYCTVNSTETECLACDATVGAVILQALTDPDATVCSLMPKYEYELETLYESATGKGVDEVAVWELLGLST
jgi:hypothetical protein